VRRLTREARSGSGIRIRWSRHTGLTGYDVLIPTPRRTGMSLSGSSATEAELGKRGSCQVSTLAFWTGELGAPV
jgi:hypothetical protein